MKLFRRRRPMHCAEVGQLLQSFLDGELADRRTTRLRAHLDDCRRCGMEAATYSRIKTSLARHGTDLPPDAVATLRAFGEQLTANPPPETT